MIIKEKDKVRFESKLEKQSNGCVLYMGGLSSNGYGSFYDGYKTILAHRFAAKVYFGKIPDGMYVLHKCDVKNCCAEEHLFFGTAKDNYQDMLKKGRCDQTIAGKSNLGKKYSLERCKKISASNKGHIVTLETREKIRKANSGKGLSEAHKLKLSIAHTGKKLSEEHKLKIGIKSKKYWNNKKERNLWQQQKT